MRRRKDKQVLPSEEDVEEFEMLSPLLNSVYLEMKEFSKKKPDEHLNTFKLKMINKLLKQVKELLSSQPTVEFLESVDEQTLPTNSDAVLVIGQFRSAMSQFRDKFYVYDDDLDEGRWVTQENPIT